MGDKEPFDAADRAQSCTQAQGAACGHPKPVVRAWHVRRDRLVRGRADVLRRMLGVWLDQASSGRSFLDARAARRGPHYRLRQRLALGRSANAAITDPR